MWMLRREEMSFDVHSFLILGVGREAEAVVGINKTDSFIKYTSAKEPKDRHPSYDERLPTVA